MLFEVGIRPLCATEKKNNGNEHSYDAAKLRP